jgi:hypothetical protein
MAKKTHIPLALILLFSLLTFSASAQKTDSLSHFSLEGYADAYYAYYTDSVGPGNFQKFPTISPRSNSFGLNILQFAAKYDGPKVRAAATLHFGDIPLSAWSTTYNFIQQAYAGVKLSKKLWLDVGFFRSHIGTELLTPRENIASSIAIPTYYEPYYESGARLDWLATPKLEINLYVLNGYNIYQDNNQKKSLGASVLYTYDDNINVGYTDYIGDDSLSGNHLRFHNNAFLNYQYKRLKLQIGGDYCTQMNADTIHTKTAVMYSAIITLKYQATNRYGIYTRGEWFQDPQGFMSGVFTDWNNKKTGYKISGLTAGIEYKPSSNSYVRLEGRILVADYNQLIFYHNGQVYNYRLEGMLHTGITFDMSKL